MGKIMGAIIKNFFIVLGILLGICILLIFGMYFFGLRVFGMVGVSHPSAGTRVNVIANMAESERIGNLNELRHIKLLTEGIAVEVVPSNADNLTQRIQIINHMQGVVRQRQNVNDTSRRTANIQHRVHDIIENYEHTCIITGNTVNLGRTLVISIYEPRRVVAFMGNSVVRITLSHETFDGMHFTFAGHKSEAGSLTRTNSNVTFNTSPSELEAGVVYYQGGSGSRFNTLSNIAQLRANVTGGRIETTRRPNFSTIPVEIAHAEVITRNAVVQLDRVGILRVRTTDSLVRANNVTVLHYTGRLSGSEFGRATGGRIVIERLDSIAAINVRSIDIDIGTLSGNVGTTSVAQEINRVDIRIRNFTGDVFNANMPRGSLRIDNATGNNFTVKGTTLRVNVGLSSQNAAARANINTTTGNVTVNGRVEQQSYNGVITVETTRGDITLNGISCQVIARVTRGANINARLYNNVKDGTSLHTVRGNVNVTIQEGTAAYLSVLGTTRRINTRPGQPAITFAQFGRPTPIFGAELAEFRMLSFTSNSGRVTVGFFVVE